MPIDPETFLGRVTFEVASVDDIPFAELRNALREHSIARIVGLFERADARAKLAGIAAVFDAKNDRRHDPRDTEAVRRNYQKLQIGARSGIDTRRTLGRFLRVLYNPIFEADVYGLRSVFVTLARLRNGLFELPRDHAVHGIDGDLFTCARIHQYPRGGGFMVPHRDHFSQIVSVEENLRYYQPFMTLSEKGVDFREGGAFVDVGEERVLYEGACRAGDVVIYDGRTVHGVMDVDPLEPLELDRFSGRIAAFASLFRVLRPGAEGYAGLAQKASELYGTDAEKI